MIANIFVPLFLASLAAFVAVGVAVIVAAAMGRCRHPFDDQENAPSNLHPVERSPGPFSAAVTTNRQLALSVWKVFCLTPDRRREILAADIPPGSLSIETSRIVSEFIGRVRRSRATPSGGVNVCILNAERDALLAFAEAADLLWLSRLVAGVAA